MKITLDHLRLLEEFGIFSIQKLTKLGGSFAIILPKQWVDYFAYEIPDEKGEPTFWMQMIVEENGEIKVSPLNVDDLHDNLKYVREKKRET